MASRRDETLKALNEVVAKHLREQGFGGRLPHMQRLREGTVDLFSVQFDKWGDGFIIELGSGRPEELRDPNGDVPTIKHARSYGAPRRARLSAGTSTIRDKWFRYSSWFRLRRRSPEKLATQVRDLIPIAEDWWQGSEPETHIIPLT